MCCVLYVWMAYFDIFPLIKLANNLILMPKEQTAMAVVKTINDTTTGHRVCRWERVRHIDYDDNEKHRIAHRIKCQPTTTALMMTMTTRYATRKISARRNSFTLIHYKIFFFINSAIEIYTTVAQPIRSALIRYSPFILPRLQYQAHCCVR